MQEKVQDKVRAKIDEYLKSFWACLGFISLVPTGRTTLLTPDEFGRFPAFYPVVGLFFGLAMFVLWLLTAPILPERATALMVVLFLVVINRGFHLDGLADAADALFSHKSREQKLLIMKDSRQGTFGVLAIVFNIMLKVEMVAIVAPLAPWALILWPVWGRVGGSVIVVQGRYVGSETGLGRWMVENSGPRELLSATAFTLLVSLAGGGAALLTALGGIFCGLALSWVWKQALDGVTGDLIGATIELTEMFTIILFYALINIRI